MSINLETIFNFENQNVSYVLTFKLCILNRHTFWIQNDVKYVMLTYINYCGIELKLENLIKDKSQDSSQFQNFDCDVKVKIFFFRFNCN